MVPTGPAPVESRFGNQTTPRPERAPSGLAARPPPEAAVGRRGQKGPVFVRFRVVLKPGFHRHGAGGAADLTEMRNFKDWGSGFQN